MNELFKIELKGEVEVRGKTIKHIEGGFGEGCKIITAKDIALEHEVELKHINELINRNITRFRENVDYIDLLNSENFKVVAYNMNLIGSNRTKNVYIFSERGYRKILNIMDYGKDIGKQVLEEYFCSKEHNTLVDFNEHRKEIIFINKLKKVLLPLGVSDGVNQYTILTYKIDYYIPSLNVAIEYDEKGHKSYTYEQHEGRQKEIENELGCRFIRVTDKESDEYNIGYVIKKIFNVEVV